jgi:hypothetical protein
MGHTVSSQLSSRLQISGRREGLLAEPSPDRAELTAKLAEPSPDRAELTAKLNELSPDRAEPTAKLNELSPDRAEPTAKLAEPRPDRAEPTAKLAELSLDRAELTAKLAEPRPDRAEPTAYLNEPCIDLDKPRAIARCNERTGAPVTLWTGSMSDTGCVFEPSFRYLGRRSPGSWNRGPACGVTGLSSAVSILLSRFSLYGSSMRRTGCLVGTLRRGGTGVGGLRCHGPMKHDPGLLHTLNPHVLVSQREVGQ